jgi:hypothetical protein
VRRLPLGLAGLVIAAGVALRCVSLDRMPGINGDEAWYGVLALDWLSGHGAVARGPSGNVTAAPHLVMTTVLHAMFPPSFALLRVPAVVAGVGQIALTAWALTRPFDRRAAWLGALVTAALPVSIAYSRFGWDSSHVGVWLALAAGLAFRRRIVWTVAAFMAAVLAHPTAVFAAPFLVCAFAGATSQHEGARRALGRTAVLVLLVAAAASMVRWTAGAAAAPQWPEITSRVLSPGDWQRFGHNLAAFFTGDATLRYIVGRGFGASWVVGAAFWTAAILPAVLGLAVAFRQRRWMLVYLVGGCAATLAAFFAAGGPASLEPHVERYGLCLVVPVVMMACAAISVATPPRLTAGLLCAASIAAALLLVVFHRAYFVGMRQTGTTSHQAFWTGAVEPKAAAVRHIAATTRHGSRVMIVADEWWSYWPVKYLAAREQDWRVSRRLPDSFAPVAGEQLFLVAFPGSELDAYLESSPPDADFERTALPGYGREAAIIVWRRR